MTTNLFGSHRVSSVAITFLISLGILAMAGGCSKKEENAAAPPSLTPVATPENVTPAAPEGTPLSAATVAPTPIPPEILSGKVIQVVRADTLKVQEGTRKVTVKLYGIDLPSKKAAILKKAKAYITKLVLKKTVSVEVREKADSRITGIVTLASGTNLSHELLKRGYASLDSNAVTEDAETQLQDQAKAAKKGMWAAPAKKKHRRRTY
ncbi:MAG: thermonuclease family protein [Pseudomonadota bacterium]